MNETMKNKALYERAGAFDYPSPLWVHTPAGPDGGHRPPLRVPPVEYKDNGDVIVRMMAEGAKEVHVTSTGISTWGFDVTMQDCGGGLFEAALPVEEQGLHGNVALSFIVDGIANFNPYLPSYYSSNKLVNYIEVYDEGAPFILLQDVPHGAVTREVFWSESVQEWVRCLVYTPPTYHEGGEFPVLYLQHGAGENETSWVINGKMAYIMDNAIAEGKAVPFVVVMNDGMLKKPGDTGMNDFDGIEGLITTDCREYIESHYRVKTDKWSRAIAGLSLGSMQASYIGMRHPELFGSIGSFTFLRCRDKSNRYEDQTHLDIVKDPEKFAQSYKLYFRSIGDRENKMDEFEEDDRFLAQYGIDKLPSYVRMIIPGENHTWNNWRRAYYAFIQLLFR